MQVTQVKIFPVNEDKLKAFVSIVFDHCFMVNDIKVIQGKDGLFLSMPSRRKKSGEFKDVAHPLNNETRRLIEEQVLREYRQVVHDATPRRPDRDVDYDSLAHPDYDGLQPAARRAPPSPPAAGVAPPAAPAHGPPAEKREKTLEEVEEMHLRDSFWSVS
jgi:stage V sporulation protein G